MPEYIEREKLQKHFENNVTKIEVTVNGQNNFAYLCDHVSHEIRNAPTADVVEVVRCKDCEHAEELDRHCDINRTAYRHCGLWRGDETRNVWHKYNKYYRNYSIVDLDGFCSEGKRKEVVNNG